MEERDDLEQMAFIQKWNAGKAEREKKENDFLEKMKRTQIGAQNLSFCLSSLFEFL